MLDIVFKGTKNGSYSYCADQTPIVSIDVVDPAVRLFKKTNITVNVCSFDKKVSLTQSLVRTVFGNCDTLDFYFDELTQGNYLVTATLIADDVNITRTAPLTVLDSFLPNPTECYNRRLELGTTAHSEFANSVYGEDVPTPAIKNSSEYPRKVDTDLELSTKNSKINKNAKYIFENDRYVYAITADNEEVIAYKENGGYIDVLAGGGNFNIKNIDNETALLTKEVKSFEAAKDSVKVTYNVDSDDKGAVCKSEYIFGENSISIFASVKYSGKKAVKHDNSRLERVFLNEPLDTTAPVNFDWRYPAGNDYPYRYTESWVVAHALDKNHRVYSYTRGDIPLRIWNYAVSGKTKNLYTYFEPTTSLDYTLHYDLVLADKRRNIDTDYISLFEGKQSDFAAGIAPTIENDDISTMFVRDSLDLNINVTNIVKEDILVAIRYDLRDYYGNILDIGEFNCEKISALKNINRELHIDAKTHGYGMFFVNLTVKSKKYTYKEYYPFALLDDYKYKHTKTSPYSICQVLPDSWVPFADSYSISTKVGNAALRCAFFSNDGGPYDEYLQKYKDDGVKILGSGTTEQRMIEFGKYFDECLYGNEINLASFWGGVPLEERFNLYYNDYFLPLRANCDKYGKKLVSAGISAAQTEWFDAIYEKGIWDQIDKFSVHVYGIPYSPECPERMDDMWSTEGGLKRTVAALEKYGKKPFQINEMGYHTGRQDACVDLRTQADYNIRSHVLCVAYGAEFSAAYGLYDFSGSGFGTSISDNEHHFGHFYMPDCFGRVLPKPSGVTFAFFTRLMESTQSITENNELSRGTVKAYTADTTEHGNVLIAWSNCSRLPNDVGDVENCSYYNTVLREPTMPWQNQWHGTEWVWISTENDSVTVVDLMGHKTVYPAHLGKVRIPLTGAPVCVLGAKL
ncbi:MAG: hypothetical protein IJN65_03490 [Clostridia bacterium]|nr:hypothetical protein [Clostridia bacterium]